ncbi:hypothetical protein [Amycolatopsis sp. H20-H5]|uniref:hypothetical protein n=1 Tax=Amycolatopsis sp. H20-H5 TaxID=3046309 RepID=UPI002DB82670|nr:hypothetical protein [Amycolatopsis sp. H20-H5]MEC3977868.1 hypothetical protein [Amycolatopsis sp. H20-H5]
MERILNIGPVKRQEAVAAAGLVLAMARRDLLERSPRESALAAYVSGGPSIDELERRIADRLGLTCAA